MNMHPIQTEYIAICNNLVGGIILRNYFSLKYIYWKFMALKSLNLLKDDITVKTHFYIDLITNITKNETSCLLI